MTRQPLSMFATPGARGVGQGKMHNHRGGDRLARGRAGRSCLKVLTFGRSYHFGDWTVTVSEPVPFAPSIGALDADKHELAAKVKYTITNTSTNREVSTAGIYVQVQVDGHQAMKIYDRRQRLGSLPSANLPPGRTVSWHEGYGYDATGQRLTVRVSDLLDFDGPIAEYVGQLPAQGIKGNKPELR